MVRLQRQLAGRPSIMELFTREELGVICCVRCTVSFTIKVGYDPEIHAYFVKASDVPGLNVASDRADDFIEIVRAVVPAILGDKGGNELLNFEFDTTAAREEKLLH
jgi:hypothetical protein